VKRRLLDLSVLNASGLRRGRTTGTCAAAAAAAALRCLRGEAAPFEDVALPDGVHALRVPIQHAAVRDGVGYAEVLKDGGDDPDRTHGATIWVEVTTGGSGALRFEAGEGVGMVTRPGLIVPVGEPAINPVPRQMIDAALQDVAGTSDGLTVRIGCINGEKIAVRTFNPRLGVVGGISILGTSGIVEPMSLASWKASVAVYVRVALGTRPDSIALIPGRIGQRFFREHRPLPSERVVRMSNFVGFTLKATQQTLEDMDFVLPRLWVAGHPGKLAKVLEGHWDTHSKKSPMATRYIAQIVEAAGLDVSVDPEGTVQGIIDAIGASPAGAEMWRGVEEKLAAAFEQEVPRAASVAVRLFSMDGRALGVAA
jgi:cobalt-precorrin-5B (C1)-methyltransferase